MNKSFAVIGLGRFGESIATELANAGADVLAVDIDKDRVRALADIVTCAVTVDIRDTEAMESLGLSNMDAVIIAVTQSIDISILATIYAKECGVPYVVAKSKDEIHTRILKKIGADKIIIPERETGIRIARHLLTGNIINLVELSDTIRMIEIDIRPEWAGHTLRELDLRKKEKINVIALRSNGELEVSPDPDKMLTSDITMLITIDKKTLNKLIKK